ncbi:MAG: hypothetical protein WCV62_00545 [Candidatus Peribacteraceae bacterium]|jgi:hypothetical protein
MELPRFLQMGLRDDRFSPINSVQPRPIAVVLSSPEEPSTSAREDVEAKPQGSPITGA